MTKYISSRYAAKASPQNPLDSGSRTTYTKSSSFQAYLQNTIRAIPSTSAQHPQQPDRLSQIKPSRFSAAGHLRHISPTSAIILMISIKPTLNSAQFNPTLLGARNQLGRKHTWDGTPTLRLLPPGLQHVLPDQPNKQHPSSTFDPPPHIHSSSLNIQYLLNSIKPFKWHFVVAWPLLVKHILSQCVKSRESVKKWDQGILSPFSHSFLYLGISISMWWTDRHVSDHGRHSPVLWLVPVSTLFLSLSAG